MANFLEIKPEHAYVLVSLAATYIVHHIYMAVGVIKARKQYKVSYPNLYADPSKPNAKEFNCVQRGMQNSLEFLPTFYALLLTTGIRYPVTASISAGLYLVGRIMYFEGYATGNPANRHRGRLMYVGSFALVIMLFKWAAEIYAAK